MSVCEIKPEIRRQYLFVGHLYFLKDARHALVGVKPIEFRLGGSRLLVLLPVVIHDAGYWSRIFIFVQRCAACCLLVKYATCLSYIAVPIEDFLHRTEELLRKSRCGIIYLRKENRANELLGSTPRKLFLVCDCAQGAGGRQCGAIL